MKYEKTEQMAERMGVTVRTIQKRAAAGKIPGAVKTGRDWKIPVTSDSLKQYVPMPLLNSVFPLGECKEYIKHISNEHERRIALGEYYYFSGQAEKAVRVVEPYLYSKNDALRYSAALIYAFANLTCDHIAHTQFALEIVRTELNSDLQANLSPQSRALAVLMSKAATVLLHIPFTDLPDLGEYMKYLPGGLKMFAGYVWAHETYLEKNYERSLAIADMALAMSDDIYPISAIYIHNVATMALMNMMRIDEAKERLAKAWSYAKQDHLIEAFGEHHGLLQGMLEVYLKETEPQVFDEIIDIVYRFSSGWRKIQRMIVNKEVADNLSTTEFAVAMLYSRNWTIKEIARHMGMSERTVKHYITVIYEKLSVHSRSGIEQFMLQ